MTLAIFDLDNTLLGGDSDHGWGEFLVEQNLVDAESFQNTNDQFYRDYCEGKLNIDAYLRFVLNSLCEYSPAELAELHGRFMQEKIEPMLLKKATELIESHRQQGHTLLVITATNRFITEPIVKRYKIPNLLASEGEIIDGRYTGEPSGIPCFAEGKVERLKQWLEAQPMQGKSTEQAISEAYFYSDSRNDIPLLEQVGHPVAVDPDQTLKETSETRGWPIISLR